MSMDTEFYRPRPIPPDENKQMIRLRWSLRVSVLGWIVYGAFAYAFADISVIPAAVQSWMVICGSLLIVCGAESNTIATTEAALSKLGTDRFSAWDVSAFLASLIGGICTPLITFSTRQPELAGTWWRQVSISLGPLILGIAGIFDFYSAITELALAKRDYVLDMEQWLDEERDWQEEQGIVTLYAHEPNGLEFNPSWPVMEKGEFVAHLGRMNGAGAELADKQKLEAFICKKERNLPSRSTLNRWRSLARKKG